MEYLVGVLLGIVGGGVIAAALMRGPMKACREGRASLERDHATLTERLAAREAEILRLGIDLQRASSVAEELGAHNADMKAAAARLTAELDAERERSKEKQQAREQLSNAFQALSAQALQINNQAFIDLATQTLGKFQKGAEGELEKRQQAIGELVAPVKQTLEKLDGRIQEIEKTREGAYQALTAQVRSLSDTQGELRRETANLVKALRQPAARGRWGELQLKRVVEMAGMIEYCDFLEQASVGVVKEDGEDARLRPDIIVRLPGVGSPGTELEFAL